jgi:hypothetical protein
MVEKIAQTLPIRTVAPMVATCRTCGAELHDPGQRFCGGDRCLHVFMRHPGQRTAILWLAARNTASEDS